MAPQPGTSSARLIPRLINQPPWPWIQLGSCAKFQWNTWQLPIPHLPPAMAGLRIVHLTDTHLRPGWDVGYDRLIGVLADNPPDLILFTGDFVEDKYCPRTALPTLRRLFSSLKSRLGTFAILGNHDGDLLPLHIEDLPLTLINDRRLCLDVAPSARHILSQSPSEPPTDIAADQVYANGGNGDGNRAGPPGKPVDPTHEISDEGEGCGSHASQPPNSIARLGIDSRNLSLRPTAGVGEERSTQDSQPTDARAACGISSQATLELIGLPGVDRKDMEQSTLLTTLPARQPNTLRIILTHYPDLWHLARPHTPDLYLAGHTHGGQVCLPTGRPILRHDSMPHTHCRGIHRMDDCWYVVNRGLGFGKYRVRLFCPAEVMELELVVDAE